MSEKNKKYSFKGLVIVAVAFLVAGIMLTAGFDITEKSEAENFWREGKAEIIPTPVMHDFADLAQGLIPSVVNISTTNVVKGAGGFPFPEFKGPLDEFFGDELFNKFFGDQQREFKTKSLGSGFIINKEGYIITNHHVVNNATEIIVKLSEGRREYKATVVGKDEKLDLALIKIEAENHLPVATLANSDNLRIGEWVIAIGNPFGLGGTVTAGIVSQKGRAIGAGPYDDFIQTDASINPGNSGGPLFNLAGEVVGINTAIIAGGTGIGFATPINVAKDVLLQLKESGSITRGWIGVTIQELTPELAEHFGIKDGRGALISSVTPGDPAEAGGLKAGDIIIEFNGKSISELSELPKSVAITRPGKVVKVKVIRGGDEKILTIKVGERIEVESLSTTKDANKEVLEEKLGFTIKPVTPAIAERFGLESATKGVLIADVRAGSPAELAGLRRGDIIGEVNREPVKDLEEYRAAMKKGNIENILFLIVRGKSIFYVTIGISE